MFTFSAERAGIQTLRKILEDRPELAWFLGVVLFVAIVLPLVVSFLRRRGKTTSEHPTDGSEFDAFFQARIELIAHRDDPEIWRYVALYFAQLRKHRPNVDIQFYDDLNSALNTAEVMLNGESLSWLLDHEGQIYLEELERVCAVLGMHDVIDALQDAQSLERLREDANTEGLGTSGPIYVSYQFAARSVEDDLEELKLLERLRAKVNGVFQSDLDRILAL